MTELVNFRFNFNFEGSTDKESGILRIHLGRKFPDPFTFAKLGKISRLDWIRPSTDEIGPTSFRKTGVAVK